MRPSLLAGLALLAFAVVALAQPPDLPASQLTRYQALIAQLRCVICQNRSIAESDVPLASDMRHMVAEQIKAGRSDDQIKDYLVERYGSFVLYKPRFDLATWLLWLGPPALLLIAVIVVVLLLRRGSRRCEPPPPNADEVARLLDDDT